MEYIYFCRRTSYCQFEPFIENYTFVTNPETLKLHVETNYHTIIKNTCKICWNDVKREFDTSAYNLQYYSLNNTVGIINKEYQKIYGCFYTGECNGNIIFFDNKGRMTYENFLERIKDGSIIFLNSHFDKILKKIEEDIDYNYQLIPIEFYLYPCRFIVRKKKERLTTILKRLKINE